MNSVLIHFLFDKHILVNETGENMTECFPTVFALARRFGIRIEKGMELAVPEMIRTAAECLGENVPEPFYRGFPESVRKMTGELRLYDQLISYVMTYGINDFSEARHSLFEETFERIAFRENVPLKSFVILTAEEARKELSAFVNAMLSGTRPLSDDQFAVVEESIRSCGIRAEKCGSKDTAMKLLLRLRDVSFARFLRLGDVIRLVEIMNYEDTGEENIRKLNLPNQKRKLISGVLDVILEKVESHDEIRDCFEKRALWCGLLHHIHYVSKSETGRLFVYEIRNAKANQSVYAAFEGEMAAGNPVRAAEILRKGKGSGAVARNLNYLLSRCKSPEEANRVLDTLGTINPIMTWQMLLQYRAYSAGQRVFKFVRFNRMKKHKETPEELGRRKSAVPEDVCGLAEDYLRKNLAKVLGKTKLGRIYIDESMRRIALPLQEAVSSSGFGVLPRGTRLAMPEGDKLRCFTYWEKVKDIDLSCFGIREDGSTVEFSWRTAWNDASSEGITYSGDQTSGYDGGSEYFGIDLEAFRKGFPDVRYLTFADNVYTGIDFDQCLCKAGYMVREKEESGQVYEPKTVKSSFTINAKSTYAILFALDLKEKDVVWLNMGMGQRERVAGEDDLSFVLPYMDILDIASVYSLFEAKADEIVSNPEDADLIVSDVVFEKLGEGQEQIHSYDYEKLLAYKNQ